VIWRETWMYLEFSLLFWPFLAVAVAVAIAVLP